MPKAAPKAFADHGEPGATLPADDDDSEGVLAQFAMIGIDIDALAARRQESFVGVIALKSAAFEKAS